MTRAGRIYVGTSGWHYGHWKGGFYPEDLPATRMLQHYKEHFRSAEINNTFYGLPSEKTLAQWRDAVPRDFVFAVKGSRYITHMKKLKDPGKPLSALLERVEVLGKKAGPVLFQLPPRWRADPGRLNAFLKALPAGKRFAFEFRDASWFGAATEKALAAANAAFCVYDLGGAGSPRAVTADFVYMRLHGPGAPYKGRYGGRALGGWARPIRRWLKEGRDVYCYFDNDEKGFAALDALKLRQLLNDG